MKHEIIGGALTLADGKTLPLSKAVRAGDFLFLSGQLGLNAQGALAGDSVEAQTRQALQNIATILAEAGAGLHQVIKATVWLVDGADFARFNPVYAEFFAQHPPVRSTVVSGLVLKGALVEIEVMAYAP
ncbi:MAG: RidA family protein [Gammaproteobacteria bacterium]|nr:RidA family protein [Gammaproteobacteria bacterium]